MVCDGNTEEEEDDDDEELNFILFGESPAIHLPSELPSRSALGLRIYLRGLIFKYPMGIITVE